MRTSQQTYKQSPPKNYCNNLPHFVRCFPKFLPTSNSSFTLVTSGATMRFITFICFTVAAIVATPAPTRDDPITAAMNLLNRLVPFQRIVGGEPLPVKGVAYGISFQFENEGELLHFCGGTILSPTKIVTAAHCARVIERTNTTKWRVAAGKTNLWTPEDFEQYTTISNITIHPNYCHTNYFEYTENDVAIIEVSTPFKFNEFVNKIELIDSEPTNGDCVMSGWEIQTAEDPDPPISHTIHVVPRDTCANNYMGRVNISSLDICAGDIRMGPCHGTGRPLVCNGALAGVASWPSIKYCHEYDLPVVFANVAALQDWIKAQL